jgi:hypothetical protein
MDELLEALETEKQKLMRGLKATRKLSDQRRSMAAMGKRPTKETKLMKPHLQQFKGPFDR